MLLIDLSSNQGSVDFARVKKAGVTGAFLKVSEGRTWNDPVWSSRARQARAAGLRVGGYHFARPDLNSAESEAAHFAKQLGTIRRRDLRPVLDFEQATGFLPSVLEKWARAFNKEFHTRAGLWPILYSYPAYLAHIQPERTIGAGLWLASYSRNDGKEHPFQVPLPWRKTVAHQFSSNCTVAGVSGHVDLSTAKNLRPLLAHPVTGLL